MRGRVTSFDHQTGRFTCDPPWAIDPSPGQAYELASPEEAPLLAMRYVMGLPLSERLPPVAVRLGTTRGTNALITRRGARTALVTTPDSKTS